MSFSNKHNLHFKNLLCFADFVNFIPSNKVWKIAVASKPLSNLLFSYL